MFSVVGVFWGLSGSLPCLSGLLRGGRRYRGLGRRLSFFVPWGVWAAPEIASDWQLESGDLYFGLLTTTRLGREQEGTREYL